MCLCAPLGCIGSHERGLAWGRFFTDLLQICYRSTDTSSSNAATCDCQSDSCASHHPPHTKSLVLEHALSFDHVYVLTHTHTHTHTPKPPRSCQDTRVETLQKRVHCYLCYQYTRVVDTYPTLASFNIYSCICVSNPCIYSCVHVSDHQYWPDFALGRGRGSRAALVCSWTPSFCTWTRQQGHARAHHVVQPPDIQECQPDYAHNH